VLICVPIILLWSSAPTQVATLPNVLEERVPLWINAWFAQDLPRLLRLTEPSHDRQLRRWVSYNPPPDDYDIGDLLKSEVRLTSIKPRGSQAVEVTAEIIIAGRSGLQKRLLMHQTWRSAAGTWYFVPPFRNGGQTGSYCFNSCLRSFQKV
jgi:hypothetical protein